MTQSDFDFVGQLVENRFANEPVRWRPSAVFARWYVVLVAGAVLTGAVIGFVA